MPTKAVLLDIDGTLLRAGGAGREAVILAVAQVAQIRLPAARQAVNALDFRGCTDSLLIQRLRTGLGVPLSCQAMLAAYVDALVGTLKVGPVELLPGVRALVQLLDQRGVHVGLLTGNVRQGARAKLAAIQLEHLVERSGGFGDDGHERGDIARLAVRRLEKLGVRPGAVVVIGDTEHDVAAARAAGAAAVTVATGWTPPDVLQAVGPDLHLPDLSDPQPLLGLLDRL